MVVVVYSLSHVQLLRPHGLYSLPGSSVCGILQARLLKQTAISFSRGSSQPRDWTHICTGRRIPHHWTTREAPLTETDACKSSYFYRSSMTYSTLKKGPTVTRFFSSFLHIFSVRTESIHSYGMWPGPQDSQHEEGPSCGDPLAWVKSVSFSWQSD